MVDPSDLTDLKIEVPFVSYLGSLGSHRSVIRQILEKVRIYLITWISQISDPSIFSSHGSICLNLPNPKGDGKDGKSSHNRVKITDAKKTFHCVM